MLHLQLLLLHLIDLIYCV